MPSKSPRKLSLVIRDQVIALHNLGKDNASIGREVGVSGNTVKQWLSSNFSMLDGVYPCSNCDGPTTSSTGFCNNNPECIRLYHESWHKPYDAVYYESNGAKIRARKRFIATGFTEEMFEECWRLQEGKCGLCFVDLDSLSSKQVHADHEPNSTPPKPRGILCKNCNSDFLGNLEWYERRGDCQITNPQLIEWQTHPPMARSSFAEELGWLVCA